MDQLVVSITSILTYSLSLTFEPMASKGPHRVSVSSQVSIQNKLSGTQSGRGHLFTVHRITTSCWADGPSLCLLVIKSVDNHHQRTLSSWLPLQSKNVEEPLRSPWWTPSDHSHSHQQREVHLPDTRKQYIQNSTCQWQLYMGFQAWSLELGKT